MSILLKEKGEAKNMKILKAEIYNKEIRNKEKE